MQSRLFVTLAIILLLPACERAPLTEIVVPVRVETITASESATSINYSAQVVPKTKLDLSFRTDGYVVNITSRTGAGGKQRPLQAGDSVSKGEVLARIDDYQYKDRLLTAQANLDKAKAAWAKADEDYARAQALKANQSITEPDFDAARQEFDTARASVNGAQAQWDEAKGKLAETALIAPQAAIINQRQIELGSLVRPGSVGFVLADTNSVKVVFGIPEQSLADVTIGASMNVRIISKPNRLFAGVVTQIAPAADQRTRAFEVSLSVDNSDGTLREGMIAEIDFSANSGTDQPILIPLDSIVRSVEGQFAVYVVQTDDLISTVHLTSIETGQVVGNRLIVISGLRPGQNIVVTGTAQISDGQIVNLIR